jgi:hypothetical protein
MCGWRTSDGALDFVDDMALLRLLLVVPLLRPKRLDMVGM